MLLLVVTLACILLSAILWPVTPPSYGDGVWPDTYEEWLYDYLYNSTRLGYDPSVWGGFLIETDNPAALVNTDPSNLTVPVFVTKALKLDDSNILAIIGRFFPGSNVSRMIFNRDIDVDGNVIAVSIRFGTASFNINRDWWFRYGDGTSGLMGNIFSSDQSAMDHAIAWLKAHNAWPDDATRMSISRPPGGRGVPTYTFIVHRCLMGFNFDVVEQGGSIILTFEAATGKVISLDYCWPDLEIPFVVSDLPTVEEVISYHHLESDPERQIFTWHSDNVTYHRACAFWDLYITHSTPIFIYLPYWQITLNCPAWPHTSDGIYGAIFPDTALVLSP